MSRTFARSALTSVFTTSLDFAVLAALVELAGVGYALATFLGTVVGSTSNFLINRAWAFRARDGHAGHQAARYVAVQAGSAALHTSGVWLLTQLGTRYLPAKVVVSIAAYLVWNYPLNRRFVFAVSTRRDSRERPSSRLGTGRAPARPVHYRRMSTEGDPGSRRRRRDAGRGRRRPRSGVLSLSPGRDRSFARRA